MPRVSVVIRCFNEAEHIGRLLAGLSQQTRVADEIIVVDSGSTDATLEIVRRFDTKVVTISPAEFTFGRSLNVGCNVATGDVIVIPSAHVYPLYDNWIELLVAPFEDAEVALTYGRQVGDHRTRFSEGQLFAKLFPMRSDPNQAHPFCNNANAAVRRRLWQSMPYNEALTGLEDLDWAKRAMQAGYKVAYVADAAVAHVHQERFSQVKNRYRREAIAHRVIFPEQQMSLGEAMKLAAVNIAGDYLSAMRYGRLKSNVIDVISFRLAQFWGTYQGFQQRGPVAKALLHHFYYPNGLGQSQEDPHGNEVGQRIQYEEARERNAA